MLICLMGIELYLKPQTLLFSKHLYRIIYADSSYYFIIAASYFILWLYYDVLIWYPFDRHLGWFYFSIILTSLYMCKDFYGIRRVAGCICFRFRNIDWLPNKVFMPICTFPSYIWKYLFAPLKCWLFEGRASSVFFTISGPVPCPLPAEVSHRLTVCSLCTSPLHRCFSLLAPKLQSHCFFFEFLKHTCSPLPHTFCSCLDLA